MSIMLQDTTDNRLSATFHKGHVQQVYAEGQEPNSRQQCDSAQPLSTKPSLLMQASIVDTTDVPTDYDSIMQYRELNNIEQSAMYVSGTAIPDKDVACRPQRHSLGNDDWIAASMFVMFALISIITYHSGTFLVYRIKEFFSNKRKYTDESARTSTSEVRYTLVLSSISSLSACLILFSRLFGKEMNGIIPSNTYKAIFIGFLALMVFFFLKALIYVFINWIFFSSTQGRKWVSSYFLLTSVSAFILFPLALIEIYSGYELPLLGFSLPLVFILYEVLVFYKLCANFRVKKNGFLLIFLYFCSVEIMPSLVFWHIFNEVNESFIAKI